MSQLRITFLTAGSRGDVQPYVALGTGLTAADLLEFLSSGPPVYVNFANLHTDDPVRLLEVVLQALTRAGRRGILMVDWTALPGRDLPDWVYPPDQVPYDWLFPQVAAVVHHGGIGTIASALRAGVPSLGVPHFYEQLFWSRRIARVGASPNPIPPERLTVERLAAAITAVTCDPAIRSRAARLSERIRAENGVETAVGLLHRYLRPAKSKQVPAL